MFDFVCWLFEQKKYIERGEFNIAETIEFGEKRPLSWVSKVCHIMNPQSYPFIYDKYIRSLIELPNIERFMCWTESIRDKTKEWNDEEIYRLDSDLWAILVDGKYSTK